MIALILMIIAAVALGYTASIEGRNGFLWGLIGAVSFFIGSNVVAFIVALVVPDLFLAAIASIAGGICACVIAYRRLVRPPAVAEAPMSLTPAAAVGPSVVASRKPDGVR